MNSIRPSEFVVELHRYSKPEDMFRFHAYADYLAPEFLYEEPYEDEPKYGEVERDQCLPEVAEKHREELASLDFTPVNWSDLKVKDLELWSYITWNIAPVEWYGGLTSDEAEITKRVTVWIKESN